MTKKFSIVSVVGLALLGAAAMIVACNPTPAPLDPQGLTVQRMSSPVRMESTLNVKGATTLDGAATLNGALTQNGAATFNSTAAFAGAVTLSTNLIHSSASITPTDGGTLTPTAKLVTLTPAGAVGVSLGSCTSGNETILYNSVNANVVITDTGNGVLAGNQTLGQYDALMLACYATKWVQVSAVSAN